MKKYILNKLLTSIVILFVFTTVAQTKTQVKYFKESNNNFLNPSALTFKKELVGKDTNTASFFRVNYLNDKFSIVNKVVNFKIGNNYHFSFDNKNNYKELIEYIGNIPNGVTCAFECDEFGRISKNTVKTNGETEIYINKYDIKGRLIETTHHDKEEKLIDGIAVTRNKYDNKGNNIETATYDKEEKLIGDYDGISITRNIYDNKENKIEIARYDKNNLILSDKYVPGIIRYKYDEIGNIIEEACYDNNNQNAQFYAEESPTSIVRYKYDEIGNIIEEAQYNIKDELVNDLYEPIKRYKYDNNRNLIEEAHFDKANKLIFWSPYVTVEYDILGNQIDNSNLYQTNYYNEIAIVRYIYDEKGNKIEESFYDTNNLLKPKFRDISLVKYKYNEGQLRTQISYFNKSNKLINGGAIIQFKYDKNGKKIEETYFNNRNKFIDSEQGYHKIIYSELSPRYYNKNGKEVFLNSETNKYE